MAFTYIIGMLRITNLLIAMFVMLYAYLFLNKTSRRSDRKPWDYLFLSSFIFTLYQIFSLVAFFADSTLLQFDNEMLRVMVEFLFSGLVLLAFVSQHDLIVRSPLILISRKVREEEERLKEMHHKEEKEESEK